MKRIKAKVKSKLLATMEFLKLCGAAKGPEPLTHCRLSNGTAVAFDGVLALGQLIAEDLEACPEIRKLALALARCDEHYSITQLPDCLQVRSGEFLAFVPCCKPESLSAANPDAALTSVGNSVLDALEITAPLITDKAEHVVTASIKINGASLLATNREIIVEAWHGHQMPIGPLIPKAAAVAILKAKKSLSYFGCSEKTATFWFEDGSWIRTQLYREPIPDLSNLLNIACEPRLLPDSFKEAVKKIEPFSDDNNIYCGREEVCSHRTGVNTQRGGRLALSVEDGPKQRIYTAKGLLYVCKVATTFDEELSKATMFFGKNLRGAICHYEYDDSITLTDADIPF